MTAGLFASLPMYDRPECAAAHDALWAGMRDRLRATGIAAPDRLRRGGDLWDEWQSPGLLFGQTCNLPFRTRLHDRLTLIGCPDLNLPDTPPGYYHSVFVTRAGDPETLSDHADRRFAFNDLGSHSGWAAPQLHAAAQGFAFRDVRATGAHRDSARAVAAGQADIAALDAHSWRLMQRHDPGLTARLQVIGRTDPTPAPPYVTAFADLAEPLADALAGAIGALSPSHRADLDLAGIVRVPVKALLDLPPPPTAPASLASAVN